MALPEVPVIGRCGEAVLDRLLCDWSDNRCDFLITFLKSFSLLSWGKILKKKHSPAFLCSVCSVAVFIAHRSVVPVRHTCLLRPFQCDAHPRCLVLPSCTQNPESWHRRSLVPFPSVLPAQAHSPLPLLLNYSSDFLGSSVQKKCTSVRRCERSKVNGLYTNMHWVITINIVNMYLEKGLVVFQSYQKDSIILPHNSYFVKTNM